ncbi:hypothetical protein SCLARK_00812 [Spiroplasma clarkii]|uniref:hypothetical protein n=1 Tax=Spiroplasma clarkii TaxID=2139 RepID=UPI000B565579|nr:hypothetical protein [Spiroplasma clarkii]ARU91441.1 hypothetical protein SCLARK_00812 [Spiroplasma clarkii]
MLRTKLLLSLCLSTVVTPVAATYSVGTNYTEKIQAIRDNVKNNSKFLHEGNVYMYGGKEYKSENQILKELLTQNPIKEVTTSSDPEKIMLDYATGKIDGDRVYGTNASDFVKVARNFYGKTILPSCQESGGVSGCQETQKSAYDRAIDSYVNPGLTRLKYSYDNSLFYDSPEEAKIAYKNTGFNTPQRTLMYYYNGHYYNAFNQNDFEKMKTTMTPAYYYEPKSSGGKYNLDKPFSVSKEDFAEVYTNKLEDDLNVYFDNGWGNILNDTSERSYNISIEIGENGDYFKVNGRGNTIIRIKGGKIEFSTKTGGKSERYEKDILDIKVSGAELLRHFDPKAFMTEFKSYDSWKTGVISNESGSNDLNDWYEKEFTVGDTSFKIYASTYTWRGSNYAHTDLKASKYQDLGFSDEASLELNQNLPNNFKYVIEAFLNSDPGKKFIKDFGNDFTFKTYLGMGYGIKQSFKRKIREFIAENETIFEDALKEDWIYSKNSISKFSVYTSNLEKEKMLKPYKNVDPSKKFELLKGYNIRMTYDEWKNDFYFFDDMNGGNVVLQERWFVSDTKTNLKDFSDYHGYNLSNTIEGAKQIQFDKQNPLLYKKVYLYNPNGELVAEEYNEDDALNYLKSILNIKQSYVHKNELKNIENAFTDFSSLISNGKYNVYTYHTKGQELYFNNYEAALESYKNNINLIASVSVVYKKNLSIFIKTKILKKTSIDQMIKILTK